MVQLDSVQLEVGLKFSSEYRLPLRRVNLFRCAGPSRRAGSVEEPVDRCDREPDHVRPRAVDALDEPRRPPLNPVRARFPRPFSRRQIPRDLSLGERDELDSGCDQFLEPDAGAENDYCRANLVRDGRQAPQHRFGVSRVGGLSHQPPRADDDGVGPEDDSVARNHRRDVLSLCSRHAQRIATGLLAGPNGLISVCRNNVEGKVRGAQKFGAAGRGRGEHQAHRPMIASTLGGRAAGVDYIERGRDMIPIQRFSSGVLGEIIRRQPPSPGRTTLAWQLTVGPALARSTSVTLHGGVLVVRSPDVRWTQEITRARETVLTRLQHLLGPENVRTLRIEK